jgi:hypothetical protein
MRKVSSVLVSLLVVAVTTGVSVAAVTLTELPVTNAGLTNSGGANYHVQGITDDGQYVTASIFDAAAATNHMAYIKVSDGSVTFLTGRQAGGRGIGYTNYAGYQLAGAACAEGNAPTNPLALGADAGATTTKYLGGTSEEQVAANNAMALDPATGNGWVVGNRDGHGNQALAWKVTAGVISATTTYSKVGVSGDTGFTGVSTTGIAVGSDKSGPSGVDGPILADVANNANAYKIPAYAGSSGRGAGNGISNNAAYAAGYFYAPPASGDSLHAFRYTLGAGITDELLPAGGDDPLVAQQTNAFDVSDNGTAVGFSYKGIYANGTPTTTYRATIWLPGQNTGTMLEDILSANGVGLGDFSYLERIISVTADGKTFAGRGVLTADGSYRGFVVTIPEPATLSFLALGGLALLRRRSR